MPDEAAYWNEKYAAACEERRPFIQLRPRLFIDGDQWCALYGENLQDGVAGFGTSPEAAAWDFDKQFCVALPRKEPDGDSWETRMPAFGQKQVDLDSRPPVPAEEENDG